jgi:nitrate reductase gamma subunit
MSPAAKESAREHLPTWFAGVGYHLGIFAGLGYVALLLVGIEPEGTLRWGLRVLLLAGALCGIGLLAKRTLTPHLRGLSCPDDFLSNLLATAFVALACARTIFLRLDAAFLAETMLLFLWVPLGKIRHCLFFFTTRYHSATHFGRRGTFPPGTIPSGTFPPVA